MIELDPENLEVGDNAVSDSPTSWTGRGGDDRLEPVTQCRSWDGGGGVCVEVERSGKEGRVMSSRAQGICTDSAQSRRHGVRSTRDEQSESEEVPYYD